MLDKRAFDRIGMDTYKTQFALGTWENFKGGFDEDFINFFEKLRDGSAALTIENWLYFNTSIRTIISNLFIAT